MGVYSEDFVLYGIKAENEDFIIEEYIDDDEDYKRYRNIVRTANYSKCDKKCSWKKGDFKLIYLSDNYSGEYSIVGLLIFRSGRSEFEDQKDLDLVLSKDDIKLLDSEFRNEMKKQNIDISGYKVGLIINRHYT